MTRYSRCKAVFTEHSDNGRHRFTDYEIMRFVLSKSLIA